MLAAMQFGLFCLICSGGSSWPCGSREEMDAWERCVPLYE